VLGGLRSFLMAGRCGFKDKLYIDRQLHEALGYDGRFLCEHHESHAASAFFPSPFEEGRHPDDGRVVSGPRLHREGRGNEIEILQELHWPDSLGLLYSAFTYYTGFKVNSGEYKVHGPRPVRRAEIRGPDLQGAAGSQEDGRSG